MDASLRKQRFWKYFEYDGSEGGEEVLSEAEILNRYYPAMSKLAADKGETLTVQQCIDNFAVVNWAFRCSNRGIPFEQYVFVYGTLMQGGINHHYLDLAEYIGPFSTPPKYKKEWLTPRIPILRPGKDSVSGEVYLINNEILEELDQLEGYPNLYNREQILIEKRRVWIYVQGYQ